MEKPGENLTRSARSEAGLTTPDVSSSSPWPDHAYHGGRMARFHPVTQSYNYAPTTIVVVVALNGQDGPWGTYVYNTSKPSTRTACYNDILGDSPVASDAMFQLHPAIPAQPTDAVQREYGYDDQRVARWLSRDPIYERGGNNLYGFLGGVPTLRSDFLGLQFDDHIRDFNAICSCKCKSVIVTGRPVAPPGVGLFIVDEGDQPYAMFGNLMTVVWTVDGNPRRCTYGQNERGYSTITPPPPRVDIDESHYSDHPDVSSIVPIAYNDAAMTATYKDFMGKGPLLHPKDNGKWSYVIDLKIDFTCKSSDGIRMMGPTFLFDDDGSFNF